MSCGSIDFQSFRQFFPSLVSLRDVSHSRCPFSFRRFYRSDAQSSFYCRVHEFSETHAVLQASHTGFDSLRFPFKLSIGSVRFLPAELKKQFHFTLRSLCWFFFSLHSSIIPCALFCHFVWYFRFNSLAFANATLVPRGTLSLVNCNYASISLIFFITVFRSLFNSHTKIIAEVSFFFSPLVFSSVRLQFLVIAAFWGSD